MPLLVGSLSWIVLRAIVGFGCAGFFVTDRELVERQGSAIGAREGFSIYMVGTFLALALGLLLIGRVQSDSAAPFNAILHCSPWRWC